MIARPWGQQVFHRWLCGFAVHLTTFVLVLASCRPRPPDQIRSPHAPACHHAARHLHGIWDTSRQNALTQTVEQLPTHLRPTGWFVIDGLKTTTSAWVVDREQTCRNARRATLSQAEFSAAGACHRRVIARLSALTRVLSRSPDARWDRAPVAVASIHDQLLHCRDRPDASLPDPAELALAAEAEVAAWLGRDVLAELDAPTLDRPEAVSTAFALIDGGRGDDRLRLRVRSRVRNRRDNRQTQAWLARSIAFLPLAFDSRTSEFDRLQAPTSEVPTPVDIARMATQLAAEWRVHGQPERAYQLDAQAVAILDELGNDCKCTVYDYERALALAALGRDALRADRRDEAMRTLKAAHAAFEHLRGPDHLDTAQVLHDLGSVHERSGHHSEALAPYREALRIRLQHLGLKQDTARTMNNLARSLYYLHALDEAIELHQATLKIRTAIFGPEHPDTATSLNNLAAAYRAKGENQLALETFEQALAIRQKTLGPNHPYTAISLHNLAEMAEAFGDHTRALQLHRQALAIRSATLGPDHVETARSQQGLGQTLLALNRPDEARERLSLALATFTAKLGPAHPETRRVRALLHDL